MAGTLTVDTIQSDSSYTSTLNVASKVNFSAGVQIGGQDATFGGMRNRIINGAMAIDQRDSANTPVVINSAELYTLDRWRCADGTTAGHHTVQRVVDAPTGSGFTYALKTTVSAADASLSTNEYAFLRQVIEGYNSADLMWGTAAASPVTVSFWVKSSLVGTYSLNIINTDAAISCPTSYTINQANTWEKKIITISGPTTNSWNTTNGIGLYLDWTLAAGSSQIGTSGTWGPISLAAPGQVNWMATLGNTFYLTGVQFEKGTSATNFEWRHYGQEMVLCQRYYQKFKDMATDYPSGFGYSYGSNRCAIGIPLNTPMRGVPAWEGSGTGYTRVYGGGNSSITVNSIDAVYYDIGSSVVHFSTTLGTTVTTGHTYVMTNSTTGATTSPYGFALQSEL